MEEATERNHFWQNTPGDIGKINKHLHSLEFFHCRARARGKRAVSVNLSANLRTGKNRRFRGGRRRHYGGLEPYHNQGPSYGANRVGYGGGFSGSFGGGVSIGFGGFRPRNRRYRRDSDDSEEHGMKYASISIKKDLEKVMTLLGL